jgi:hypothetical protein
MRGRGRSDPVDDRHPVGMDEEVADLEAVRAHAGPERAEGSVRW